MWNVDFSQLVSSFTLKRINELEVNLLTCLGYHVKLSVREYAKYYFLLRSMLFRYGLGEKGSTSRIFYDAQLFERCSAKYETLVIAARRRTRSFNGFDNLSKSTIHPVTRTCGVVKV